MNKKIVSLMIALTLPLTFLVGCKKSTTESASPEKVETFVMTENTIANDGDAQYSAQSYKKAFFSTENYSVDYLQNEFETIVNEITKKEDKDELLELLDSYSNTKDGDFEVVKSTYDKYNSQDENDKSVTLDSNALYEISSRLYKATLNATKKYYDINDFYIYYKNHLLDSSNISDEEENEIRMTTIKEFTIANIYKTAYNDSFISKIKTSVEQSSNEEETKQEEVVENAHSQNTVSNETSKPSTTTKPSNNKNDVDDKEENNKDEVVENTSSDDTNKDDESYSDYLELTETVKSQIYDAGVNCAIEFIALGENKPESASQYCREIYDGLENDNSLGDNKEEGYNSFLEGFKTTLENNNIEFN